MSKYVKVEDVQNWLKMFNAPLAKNMLQSFENEGVKVREVKDRTYKVKITYNTIVTAINEDEAMEIAQKMIVGSPNMYYESEVEAVGEDN